MIPAFRRVNDYPTELECLRLRRGLSPWARVATVEADFEAGRETDLFVAGAIQTKKDVQPSRFEPWRLWRNASGFRLLQTEKHPFVVNPADGWFDKVDLYRELRAAKTCMVPMGKTVLFFGFALLSFAFLFFLFPLRARKYGPVVALTVFTRCLTTG
jgi:hypothetical protein